MRVRVAIYNYFFLGWYRISPCGFWNKQQKDCDWSLFSPPGCPEGPVSRSTCSAGFLQAYGDRCVHACEWVSVSADTQACLCMAGVSAGWPQVWLLRRRKLRLLLLLPEGLRPEPRQRWQAWGSSGIPDSRLTSATADTPPQLDRQNGKSKGKFHLNSAQSLAGGFLRCRRSSCWVSLSSSEFLVTKLKFGRAARGNVWGKRRFGKFRWMLFILRRDFYMVSTAVAFKNLKVAFLNWWVTTFGQGAILIGWLPFVKRF